MRRLLNQIFVTYVYAACRDASLQAIALRYFESVPRERHTSQNTTYNIYIMKRPLSQAAPKPLLHSFTLSRCDHLTTLTYIAPSRCSTTNTVLNRILISSPMLQSLMYFVSSATTSSKSVISLRPLTCHIPVIPGLVASLAR